MNTKLIIGVVLGLLLLGPINSNAQYYRGAGACGYYRGGYGGCYRGGYGYGYGYGGYGCGNIGTLLGVAAIVGAAAPILTTAVQPVQYVQPVVQQPQVIILQSR